jgi:hypothetical protein
MILISLMLAATPAPAVRPDQDRRRVVRPGPAPRATRSKRLIELEAVVRSLPLAASEPGPAASPQGL